MKKAFKNNCSTFKCIVMRSEGKTVMRAEPLRSLGHLAKNQTEIIINFPVLGVGLRSNIRLLKKFLKDEITLFQLAGYGEQKRLSEMGWTGSKRWGFHG